MNPFNSASKNQLKSGKNKPDVERVQDLLMGRNLLIFAYLIINPISEKGSETPTKTTFKLLLRPTYLSSWLGDVTMLFLGLINKNKAYFLIPKTLSIAHSSSYFVAA